MTDFTEQPGQHIESDADSAPAYDAPGFDAYALAELAKDEQGRSVIASMQAQLGEGLERIIAELAFDLAKERRALQGDATEPAGGIGELAQWRAAGRRSQQDKAQTRELAEHILYAAVKTPSLAGSEAELGSANGGEKYALLTALLK